MNGWTYCHQGLPAEDGWYEVALHWRDLREPVVALWTWDAGRWLIRGSASAPEGRREVYAWRQERKAPPLTPEALAYLGGA